MEQKEMIRSLLDELVGEVGGRVLELKELLEIDVKEEISCPQPMLELEEENFWVDSVDWEQLTNGQEIILLENPEKDIWEYVDGVFDELLGQQLFTWSAAMRKTKKARKRMPTDKEFNQFEKKDFGKIVYAGHRDIDGSFNNLSSYTNFWSSSILGTGAWKRNLNSINSTVNRHPLNQTYGFSVRCLKN